MEKGKIKTAIRRVGSDPNAWLAGNVLLRRLPFISNSADWIDELRGSSYILEKAPIPEPDTVPLGDDSPIKLVHQAGDASMVWSVGSRAFCKVKIAHEAATPEWATLQFLQTQQPTFQTPKVLFHAEHQGLSYLILERLPGRTLDLAWPDLSIEWRRHYVEAVAKACIEMAQWRSDRLGGVDGKSIPEYYLQPRGSAGFGTMSNVCQEIGMDCSDLVFSHFDLGPTNIIVEQQPSTGVIGIIDFEIAGYLPRIWVRTKFRVSGGLNLSQAADPVPTRWRSEVQNMLEGAGFRDCVEAWNAWRASENS